jgi:hypothetical protein
VAEPGIQANPDLTFIQSPVLAPALETTEQCLVPGLQFYGSEWGEVRQFFA